MYCPNCGKQNVKNGDQSPNGGVLYVAEECHSSTEYFDEAQPYECLDCAIVFYLGQACDSDDKDQDEE
jgi:predicted RNA-binding Zn-ribbon protein involved in translation (DUF1610 family)